MHGVSEQLYQAVGTKSILLALCTLVPAREQHDCACSMVSRKHGSAEVLSSEGPSSGDAHVHASVGPSSVLVLYVLLSVVCFLPLASSHSAFGIHPIYLLICIICHFSSFSSGRLEVQPWLIPAAAMGWSHAKDAKRGKSYCFLG